MNPRSSQEQVEKGINIKYLELDVILEGTDGNWQNNDSQDFSFGIVIGTDTLFRWRHFRRVYTKTLHGSERTDRRDNQFINHAKTTSIVV